MPRNNATRLLILFLFIVCALLGYNYFFKPFADTKIPQLVQEQPEPTTPPSGKLALDDLVNSMTPEEQVSQLLAVPVLESESGSQPEAETESATRSAQSQLPATSSAFFDEAKWMMAEDQSQSTAGNESMGFRPGFYIFYENDLSLEDARKQVSSLRQSASVTKQVSSQESTIVPSFIAQNEGGRFQSMNGEGFTQLPSWQETCQMDIASRSAALRRTSLELTEVGIDIVFAPVLDLANNNPVLINRICSSDPEVVATTAIEYIALFEIANIKPVVKHFPGLGQITRSLDTGFQSITPNQVELNIFRAVIDAFPTSGIMSSFVGVTAQDPDLPCALSKDCVGQLVHEYPNALLFTDEIDKAAAGHQAGTSSATISLSARVKSAISAGNHVVVFGQDADVLEIEQVVADLSGQMAEDEEFKTQVGERLRHILQYKQERGLL